MMDRGFLATTCRSNLLVVGISSPIKNAQLTNKSAKITLRDADGKVVLIVNYAEKGIKSGFTVLVS